MRLLIITQKVDKEDPILGFFHNWILELSKKIEKISVICLQKGKYDLPENVKIYSLGKEHGGNKVKYIKNFFNLILNLRKEYNSVFVHMNQEYVLLGGPFWKIMRKKIFLWRNHPSGNFFTVIAVWLSDKVFCTSRFAFVVKYEETSLMPVGIDTERFTINDLGLKKKNSILFLGRVSPIKRPGLLIEALNILKNRGVDFVCDFYGSPLSKDEGYFNALKKRTAELGLNKQINFYKAVANYETPKIYNEHDIFVNLTPTGSFDKTILEAAACGCVLVTTNQSLSGEIDGRMIVEKEGSEDIAEKMNFWLNIEEEEKKKASDRLQKYVLKNHSLDVLIEKLCTIIKK